MVERYLKGELQKGEISVQERRPRDAGKGKWEQKLRDVKRGGGGLLREQEIDRRSGEM